MKPGPWFELTRLLLIPSPICQFILGSEWLLVPKITLFVGFSFLGYSESHTCTTQCLLWPVQSFLSHHCVPEYSHHWVLLFCTRFPISIMCQWRLGNWKYLCTQWTKTTVSCTIWKNGITLSVRWLFPDQVLLKNKLSHMFLC